MKAAVLAMGLVLAGNTLADVVELEDATAKSVIEVYEEMREEEQDVGSDNQWIHEFEKDSIGTEMDHLSGLRKTAATQEEM